MANRLAAETSPYLRQHAENPVDWYPWGDEAFAEARRRDCAVLLSVGYSACHWCHVMAHECFEDPEIAALMNRLFVNIKVDREERPDVDAVYMQAVQAMTGQGGWPMTVFLSPDGAPFVGGTYFPPRDARNMPGFPRVLTAVSDAYANRRDEVLATGAELLRVLTPPVLPDSSEITHEQLDYAADSLAVLHDDISGGLGGAPKFPHPAALDFLLRRWWRSRDRTRWITVVHASLDVMAAGGVRDQLGGGFHRYCVDATWTVPHFEKMLYDNAQLAVVYLHAYMATGEARHRAVCESTLAYVVDELQLPGGGFASAQDADDPGGEGSYYSWTPAQFAEVLEADDASFARSWFGVSDEGNFEHGASVLSQRWNGHSEDPDTLARIERVRCALLEQRRARPAPARDDKVITSWNALAIDALAQAGRALQQPQYVDAAARAAEFVWDLLRRSDGALLRSWCGVPGASEAFLEDHAALANAMVSLFEATGHGAYLDRARTLVSQMRERFYDAELGFVDTVQSGGLLPVRPRTLDDNPIPSGRSSAALAFLRIGALDGDAELRALATATIGPMARAITQSPLALGNLAIAADFAAGDVLELAITGSSADALAMIATAQQTFDPWRVFAHGDPGSCGLMGDRDPSATAAYLCHHFVCEAPVTDPGALASALQARAAATSGQPAS